MAKTQRGAAVKLMQEKEFVCIERKALFGLIRWAEKLACTSIENYIDIQLNDTVVDRVTLYRGGKFVHIKVPDDLYDDASL